jgi:hypothetical protein
VDLVVAEVPIVVLEEMELPDREVMVEQRQHTAVLLAAAVVREAPAEMEPPPAVMEMVVRPVMEFLIPCTSPVQMHSTSRQVAQVVDFHRMEQLEVKAEWDFHSLRLLTLAQVAEVVVARHI